MSHPTKGRGHRAVSPSRSAAALAALACTVSACGIGSDVIGRSATGTSDQRPPPEAAVVVLGITASETSERQGMLEDLERLVLPALIRHRATVVVGVIDDRTDTAPIVLARADFSRLAAGAEGNPIVAQKDADAARADLLQRVRTGLRSLPVSQASAVFGAIRWAGSVLGQYGSSTRKLGVVLSDAVDTTTGCQIAARDLGEPALDQVIAECTHNELPAIAGTKWVMGGAGKDIDHPLPAQTAIGMQHLYERFFNRCHADLITYTTTLVAGDLDRHP